MLTGDRRAPLERWLTTRVPGARDLRVGEANRPFGGYSAETLILPVTYELDSETRTERLVLRMETDDPPVYPEQAPGTGIEIELQYRAMRALARASSVPIAPLLGFERDPAVIGTPFFVMAYVDGQVPAENPIYTREGFFADARAEQRARMLTDGLRVLAAVHAVDWRAAGFEWLVPDGVTPGFATQLALWEEYTARELDGRVHPPLERAFAWLRTHQPDERPVALCWGDPRPGNMIWRDDVCVCATDWEAAAIAPPEVDLGWWLMFDRWSHETAGVDRLPGEPTRDEQRALYESFAHREVGDTYAYELFAAARYAAIVVRVMNRAVARGQMPADQTIWLENPAVDCLVELLESRASAGA
jgi:aminoglycoside phosphotransferase (APT) family kinase protein